MSRSFDVIVVGGGSPGQHCASAPVPSRLRVTLVEHELAGGECAARIARP